LGDQLADLLDHDGHVGDDHMAPGFVAFHRADPIGGKQGLNQGNDFHGQGVVQFDDLRGGRQRGFGDVQFVRQFFQLVHL